MYRQRGEIAGTEPVICHCDDDEEGDVIGVSGIKCAYFNVAVSDIC
jgi:hypothetical protein